MDRLDIPWKSWVVVCDGAKALFLRNDGDADLLNLTPVEVAFEPHAAAHDLGTDRPGRVHHAAGGGRSATDGGDLHARAEDAFLGRIADAINVAARDRLVARLVLVAPPRALGVLREQMTDAARKMISMEIPKELARLPISEIESHLSAARIDTPD